MEFLALFVFVAVCLLLMAGYPVALTLAGTALGFALLGTATDTFDQAFLEALPNRLYGIMNSGTAMRVSLAMMP